MYCKINVRRNEKLKRFVAKKGDDLFAEKEFVGASIFEGDVNIPQEVQKEIEYWKGLSHYKTYGDAGALAPYQYKNGIWNYDCYELHEIPINDLIDSSKSEILVHPYDFLNGLACNLRYFYRGDSLKLMRILGDHYQNFNINPNYLYQFTITNDLRDSINAGKTDTELGRVFHNLLEEFKNSFNIPSDLSDYIKTHNIDVEKIENELLEKYITKADGKEFLINFERVVFDEDSFDGVELKSEDKQKVKEFLKDHYAKLICNGFVVNMADLDKIAKDLKDNEKIDIVIPYTTSGDDMMMSCKQLDEEPLESEDDDEKDDCELMIVRMDKETILNSPSGGKNCYMTILQDEEADDYGYYY